ncbi:hypothetical protein MMC15_004581 [Xylographa vitiligo]|nr:hypothetical protein [Xylographa vitiligo]
MHEYAKLRDKWSLETNREYILNILCQTLEYPPYVKNAPYHGGPIYNESGNSPHLLVTEQPWRAIRYLWHRHAIHKRLEAAIPRINTRCPHGTRYELPPRPSWIHGFVPVNEADVAFATTTQLIGFTHALMRVMYPDLDVHPYFEQAAHDPSSFFDSGPKNRLNIAWLAKRKSDTTSGRGTCVLIVEVKALGSLRYEDWEDALTTSTARREDEPLFKWTLRRGKSLVWNSPLKANAVAIARQVPSYMLKTGAPRALVFDYRCMMGLTFVSGSPVVGFCWFDELGGAEAGGGGQWFQDGDEHTLAVTYRSVLLAYLVAGVEEVGLGVRVGGMVRRGG